MFCLIRLSRWLLLLLLCGLLGACAALEPWLQQKIYRPATVATRQTWTELLQATPDVHSFTLAVNGEHVEVLFAPGAKPQPSRPPVRVFFLHGTSQHALQNLPKAAPMQRQGLDVYLPDYRGWGISTLRTPSESSIHADAWSVWQALRADPANQGVRWVLYGHSMGSGVATELARRIGDDEAVCAMVLESSFPSFPRVAEYALGTWGAGLTRLGSEHMDSASRIQAIRQPLVFLHGSADDTIPMALGRELYEIAPSPKEWHDWPLGHTDLQDDTSGGYERVWQHIGQRCQALVNTTH